MPTLEDIDPKKPGGLEPISSGAGYIREARGDWNTTLAVQHTAAGLHKFPSTNDPAARLGNISVTGGVLNLKQPEGWREVSGANAYFTQTAFTNFSSVTPKPLLSIAGIQISCPSDIIFILSVSTSGNNTVGFGIAPTVSPALPSFKPPWMVAYAGYPIFIVEMLTLVPVGIYSFRLNGYGTVSKVNTALMIVVA